MVKNKGISSAIFLLDQKIESREFLDRINTIALFFDSLDEKEIQVLDHEPIQKIKKYTKLSDEEIEKIKSEMNN